MNVFQAIFKQRQAFVAYITAGHPNLAYTEQAALALIRGGVDILEMGLPFSDPIADGPSIQAAMQTALNAGVNLNAVLNCIQKIKQQTSVPIVLFSYYNPLLAVGLDEALKRAVQAGVDAVLIVDLPLEESETYFELCRQHKLEPVGLLAPSTHAARIKKISASCDAFSTMYVGMVLPA
jgi:tryptophan synthase alpha chain